LLRAEGHGRCNNSIEEGGGVGGGVVANGGRGARGDVLTNEMGGGFWDGRAFVRPRRVDDESIFGEGRAESSGFRVAVLRGEVGVGEDIINIDVGVKGGVVEGVENGVHGGVGNSGDKVPSKGGAGETKVDSCEIGGEEGEDEGVGVGWREKKGPVKVDNISSMEVDELIGAKGGLERVEVR
jgi:hypothetical protein